jgi:hypothetical protein
LLVELELLVDSSEQFRERPGEREEQERFYSSKQKGHTFKTQFIVLPKGEDIVDVKTGDPGPTSDINQFRERQHEFSPNQMFRGDKAYIGEPQILTPHKKPPKGKLTAQQKQENKEFSKKRIYIEHTIRIFKVFKVARERFRLSARVYKRVILTICGLVRLRLGSFSLPSQRYRLLE